MTPAKLRAIVLDFDGVIIESNDVKTEAFRHVFARYPEHLEPMMSYHAANISLSRFAKFDHFIRARLGKDEDPELREELAAAFTQYAAARLEEVPFVPGALEFLEEFSPRIPLFLASVTPDADLRATLEARKLSGYFRGVYGCPPWTKAEAARDATGLIDCDPSEVILIGDSPGDRIAAAEARVEFVARDSGIIFQPPMEQSYPDMFAIAALIRERFA